MNKFTIEISPSYICRVREGFQPKNESVFYSLTKESGSGYALKIDGQTCEAVKHEGNTWGWTSAHSKAEQIYLPALSRALDTLEQPSMTIAEQLKAAMESGDVVEICHTYSEPFTY